MNKTGNSIFLLFSQILVMKKSEVYQGIELECLLTRKNEFRFVLTLTKQAFHNVLYVESGQIKYKDLLESPIYN